VKDLFSAMGGDKQGLLALSAEDIEWIIPGEDWPLAGTHRGHAGLADLLQKASGMVETSYPEPPEFVAQGDRVLALTHRDRYQTKRFVKSVVRGRD
jgi:ketosteroid isomerase-like protein